MKTWWTPWGSKGTVVEEGTLIDFIVVGSPRPGSARGLLFETEFAPLIARGPPDEDFVDPLRGSPRTAVEEKNAFFFISRSLIP